MQFYIGKWLSHIILVIFWPNFFLRYTLLYSDIVFTKSLTLSLSNSLTLFHYRNWIFFSEMEKVTSVTSVASVKNSQLV